MDTNLEWYKDISFTVTNINWERIFFNFTIETDFKEPVQFYLTRMQEIEEEDDNGNEDRNYISSEIEHEIIDKVELNYDKKENGKYYFSINMSAVSKRSFLENGEWSICAFFNSGFSIAEVKKSIAYKLDDYSRIFRYGADKYAYSVSLDINNSFSEILELRLNSYFMIVNKKWKKRKYVQEAMTKPAKIKRLKYFAVIILIRIFYKIMSTITPKKGNKILFMTENKETLQGNLKYLDDGIKRRGLDKEFKLSYSMRNAVGSKNSPLSWLKVVSLIATQDYIFIDDYAPIFGFFKLNPHTKLIQVWHAGEGFKSVGFSRFGKAGSPFPSGATHKAYDYALTGSKRLIKVYEEVFGIEKEAFLPVGMLRLDDFLEEDKVKKVKDEFFENYPDLTGKQIILFAPTFRGTGQKDAYYEYEQLDMKRIYEFCGDDKVFLIKMHPYIINKVEIPEEYAERIIDFTEFNNINDLYHITDILITDYSSSYYEFSLLRRPILFFTYDREFYELTRGIHQSVKENAPGKVCDTFEDLMDALENKDYNIEKTIEFADDNFEEYGGCATDSVIDQILLGGKHDG